jgi:hypothetical protein
MKICEAHFKLLTELPIGHTYCGLGHPDDLTLGEEHNHPLSGNEMGVDAAPASECEFCRVDGKWGEWKDKPLPPAVNYPIQTELDPIKGTLRWRREHGIYAGIEGTVTE